MSYSYSYSLVLLCRKCMWRPHHVQVSQRGVYQHGESVQQTERLPGLVRWACQRVWWVKSYFTIRPRSVSQFGYTLSSIEQEKKKKWNHITAWKIWLQQLARQLQLTGLGSLWFEWVNSLRIRSSIRKMAVMTLHVHLHRQKRVFDRKWRLLPSMHRFEGGLQLLLPCWIQPADGQEDLWRWEEGVWLLESSLKKDSMTRFGSTAFLTCSQLGKFNLIIFLQTSMNALIRTPAVRFASTCPAATSAIVRKATKSTRWPRRARLNRVTFERKPVLTQEPHLTAYGNMQILSPLC